MYVPKYDKNRLNYLCEEGKVKSQLDESYTPGIQIRHTCCTRLVEAGVDIKSVQYFMGHKDIKTTLTYYAKPTDKMMSKLHSELRGRVSKPMQLNREEMELLAWAFEKLEEHIWSDDNKVYDITKCKEVSAKITELKLKLRTYMIRHNLDELDEHLAELLRVGVGGKFKN